MTNKKFTFKKITLILFVAVLFLMQHLAILLFNTNFAKKDIYAGFSPITDITISNGDFTNSTSSEPGEPNSFTSVGDKGNTIAGVIDTNVESFEEKNEDKYKLEFNPSHPQISEDSKILMINNQNLNTGDHFGYTSTNFTLAKNGYYVVSAYVYTQFDETTSSVASLYLSNEKLDTMQESRIEKISTRGAWKEYRFYVTTASSDESVNLGLYIGTKDNYKSDGAVFFDTLTAKSLSAQEYYNQVNNANISYKEIILTSKDVTIENGINNGDFETNTLDFTKLPSSTGASTVNSVAKIVGIGKNFNNEDSLIEVDPTSANRINNTHAFLINNASEDYVAFESNEILFKQHKSYKLSIDVKTSDFDSNGANIILKQINPFDSDKFTVATASFTDLNTTSETNELTNDWITYSFYVLGNVFKDSTAKLTISVGAENKLTKGYALFDNIRIEEITTSEYNNSSTGSYSKTIDLSNLKGTQAIKNGALNNVTIESTNDGYPYKASDITVTNSNIEDNFNGIINVNKNNFDSKNYPFTNPVSIYNSDSSLDYNNVLVLGNKVSGYQSAKTSTFNLSASKYYKVSAYVNTQNLLNTNFNITLSTEKETIAQIKNIDTNNKWQEIAFFVKTFEEEKTCYITFDFGTQLNANKGYVFIDDLDFSTIEETEYNAIVTNSVSYKSDLSKLDLSLVSESSNENFYDSKNFVGTKGVNEGEVKAGVINISTHPTLDVGYVNSPYLLTINNITDSYYSFKSNDYKLTSGNYYKISVAVRTLYARQDSNNTQYDEDENAIAFGAKIELTGLNKGFKGIVTGNDFETYTFYVKATTDTTINFNLSLGDTNAITSGYAFFDAMSIESIDETAFETINNDLNKDNEKVLVIGSTENTEDNTDSDSTTNTASNFDWLLLPTLITAIALLIAMIGLIIRKLNIKLPVRTKVKDYDRAKTIVREHERREALKQREARLQALREQLQQIQTELNVTKEEYKSSKSLKEEIKKENIKIEAKIKESYKDVTSRQALEEERKLKLEAKAKIKQARKEAYERRRNELINKYLEIEKEIEMILAEERMLVEEYKAYKKQLKLEKAEKKASQKAKK